MAMAMECQHDCVDVERMQGVQWYVGLKKSIHSDGVYYRDTKTYIYPPIARQLQIGEGFNMNRFGKWTA